MKRTFVVAGVIAVLTSACGASTENNLLSGSASSPRTTASPFEIEPSAVAATGGDASIPDAKSSTEDTTALSQPSTPEPPEENTVSAQPTEPNVDGRVAEAVTDLAIRLDVDESDITVVTNERVTWPDGSLGCPQPGMSYTQSLVDGSLIVLEVDGINYEYHSSTDGDPFYCATPTPPAPAGYGDK